MRATSSKGFLRNRHGSYIELEPRFDSYIDGKTGRRMIRRAEESNTNRVRRFSSRGKSSQSSNPVNLSMSHKLYSSSKQHEKFLENIYSKPSTQQRSSKANLKAIISNYNSNSIQVESAKLIQIPTKTNVPQSVLKHQRRQSALQKRNKRVLLNADKN